MRREKEQKIFTLQGTSPRRTAFAFILSLGLVAVPGASMAAEGPPAGDAVARDAPARPEIQQQALYFWQSVAAKPGDRMSLLKAHFSAGLVQRNGEASLNETFAMLAQTLGSAMASLTPTTVLGNDQEGELHYTLKDGRRVALMLTLLHPQGRGPLIDRFGVKPLPPIVPAVRPVQLPATIAAHIRAEHQAQRFSGAVLVARGDAIVHAQAIGLADRRSGRVNTLDTPINLGSINKMFTAIAIAQLQAAGRLEWHDTVGKHLPHFPNAAIRDQVTIHQLLTHTSGVGSYWNDAYAANKHRIDTQQQFLQTFVDQPLLFKPGERIEYSNGGPVILGLVIEALSGRRYEDYVRQHIYQPAGMKHSDHFRRDDRKAGFALGYIPTDGGRWLDNQRDLGLSGSAAGGGYASALDMHRFSRALSEQRLLSRSQLEVLWKPYTQPGPIGYGYLFSVGHTAGRRWVGHNGGAPGISAEFMHYPDDGLVIIVLANQDNAATPMREWLHALLEASLGAGG
jgi:CubicO group peptidase (beta-lactamase class C family)